jgi:hypothetical protein
MRKRNYKNAPFSTFTQCFSGYSSHRVWQENEINGIWIEKQVNPFIFADSVVMFIEYPKEIIKKLWRQGEV